MPCLRKSERDGQDRGERWLWACPAQICVGRVAGSKDGESNKDRETNVRENLK